MQVISASRLLRAGLESAGHHIDADTVATRVIYGNPTPEKLARYLLSLIKDGGVSTADDDTQQVESTKALWQKYISNPPRRSQAVPTPRTTGRWSSLRAPQVR